MGSELIGSRFETQERRKKSGGRSWCWAANRQEAGLRLKKEEWRKELVLGSEQTGSRFETQERRKKSGGRRRRQTANRQEVGSRRKKEETKDKEEDQKNEQRRTTNNTEQSIGTKKGTKGNNEQYRTDLFKQRTIRKEQQADTERTPSSKEQKQ